MSYNKELDMTEEDLAAEAGGYYLDPNPPKIDKIIDYKALISFLRSTNKKYDELTEEEKERFVIKRL